MMQKEMSSEEIYVDCGLLKDELLHQISMLEHWEKIKAISKEFSVMIEAMNMCLEAAEEQEEKSGNEWNAEIDYEREQEKKQLNYEFESGALT